MPKFAIGNNKYFDKTVVVPANTTLAEGQVLGEVTATGNLAPCASANTDGSQVPEYILVSQVINATANPVTMNSVRVMSGGEVDGSEIVFSGTETINTIVTGKGSMFTLLKNAGINVNNIPDVVS